MAMAREAVGFFFAAFNLGLDRTAVAKKHLQNKMNKTYNGKNRHSP
jgi:hypothetical protein